MKQPPRQRTIKDERDEKIGKDAKVYAFEWIIAITQVLTIMCIIKGNPAWKGTISILFFGVAFLLFYEFKQYEAKLQILLERYAYSEIGGTFILI